MDAIVSLVILLLVSEAGASKHADRPTGLAVTSPRTMAPMEYWQAVLPETPIPKAIHDLLTQSTGQASKDNKGATQGHNIGANHSQGKIFSKGPHKVRKEDEVEMQMQISNPQFEDHKKVLILKGVNNHILLYGPKGKEDLGKISTSYGPQVDEDVRKVTALYGSQHEKDLRKISTSYGPQGQDDLRKISTSYGSQGEEDLRKVSTSYGSKHEEDLRKISTSKMRTSYGSQGEEDLRKISTSYGSEGEEELRKISTSYESQGEEDLRKISTSYGSHGDKDLRKINTLYGSQGDEDLRKISTSYGSRGEYLRKINTSYGPQGDNDLKKISTSYGSKGEDNSLKITVFDNQQIASKKVEASKGHRHNHVHSHNDNGNKVADVFFFHDVLRPGSMITPIIPPTTSLPTLLPRHEANSVPFSTKRLDDILAMFTPASRAMADEIRWTLDTCEHPRPVPGENAGCATSLESLAKLPAALLGTRNVRAISGDMPVDPAGTMARRGRYNVTAVQKLSESPVAAVCHDLTYPYAVFYCHTTNPTAAYLVTLEAEDSAAPAMEALAVCHLDTSQWSPRQPFLVAHNLRPGDVAVCHFLSKLSIVWVPAEEQGGVRAAL
ncbi:unnamed protein product [Urochloa decumbens]|uniref:BURP domain-containing protein n=1 Tax=Urochloa decumbens TaxID=240449 RepID=A0ABC9DSB5_9POAL